MSEKLDVGKILDLVHNYGNARFNEGACWARCDDDGERAQEAIGLKLREKICIAIGFVDEKDAARLAKQIQDVELMIETGSEPQAFWVEQLRKLKGEQ